MTAMEDVLRKHGYDVSEETVVGYLDALLSAPRSAAIDMSSADLAFIAEYAGVAPASRSELDALDAHSAGRAAAEAVRTLSRRDTAALLGIDPSRVSHQATAGRLYSYPGTGGRPVFPDWQFIPASSTSPEPAEIGAAAVLPHLPVVIAALPEGSHPVAIRTFMTTPSDDLAINGRALAPCDWLVGGGDPQQVVGMAVTLGEQV